MDKQELFYRVALERRQEQDQRNRDFSLKAVSCLGVATTIVGITALILNGFLQGASKELTTLSESLLVVGTVVYVGVLVCAVFTMMVRDWLENPTLRSLSKNLHDFEDKALVEWVSDEFMRATEANEKVLACKAQALTGALLLLTVLPVLLFIFVVTLGD